MRCEEWGGWKKPKKVQNVKPKEQPKNNAKTTNDNNTNIIQINKQNTDDDIKHVIKRFKKNNNPALSLFIAKKYYDQGKYSKSYNYALITNGINKGDE